MNELRVLIVANDPLVRSGLATVLAEQPGVTIAGRVGASADVAAEAAVCRANVVVWDLGWDPAAAPLALLRSTLDAVSVLEEGRPAVVVLLPSPAEAGEVWAAGAKGLLLRDGGGEKLVSALEAAGQGLVVVDPALAAALLPDRDQPPEALPEPLTPRELEVLQLLADGLPNKTIALRLGISDHTVKFHVNAILGKLDVQSRTEAVVRATRLGLVIL